MRKIGSIFHDNCTEIWSGSTATQSISSGIETHKNGTCNIEIYKNIGVRVNCQKMEFQMIMCKILMFLSINLCQLRNHQSKNNVTDEGNLQVKSSNQESR